MRGELLISLSVLTFVHGSRGPTNLGECQICMSRSEQLAQGVHAFIPLFLKFHKVGSGTIAELFRRHCADISRRLGGKEIEALQDASEFSNEGAPVPWWRGGKFCGKVPHEHASLDMFSAGGIERFEACAQHRGPVRLYTVLRDPVQKFFSACYFWRRQVPVGLARKLSRPANLTIHDVDALARTVFRYRNNSSGRLGRAGALLQYSQVLGQLHTAEQWDNPTQEETEAACSALRRDFTVGTTEQMESLIVLIALENRWPLSQMCYFNSHVNKARPRGDHSFPPEVLSHLRRIFAPDAAIIDCARRTHVEQTQRHNNFSAALALFQSKQFRAKCEAIKQQNSRADASLSKREARIKRARSCWLHLPPAPFSASAA